MILLPSDDTSFNTLDYQKTTTYIFWHSSIVQISKMQLSVLMKMCSFIGHKDFSLCLVLSSFSVKIGKRALAYQV